MNIYIDLSALMYFVVTVGCGIAYGLHCFKDGVRRGADDMVEMLEDNGIIRIDEETGEILPATKGSKR